MAWGGEPPPQPYTSGVSWVCVVANQSLSGLSRPCPFLVSERLLFRRSVSKPPFSSGLKGALCSREAVLVTKNCDYLLERKLTLPDLPRLLLP